MERKCIEMLLKDASMPQVTEKEALEAIEKLKEGYGKNCIRNVVSKKENEMLEMLLIAPLCIIQDRYGGSYSGVKYLAFNMEPDLVAQLDVDAGDMSCRDFWEYEAENYDIGKGNTPLEALRDLYLTLGGK